jgi:hypothetical protein
MRCRAPLRALLRRILAHMTYDPAQRAALEHQAATLAPIAARLHAATAHPPIAPYDWGGPAARGFDELEQRLRSRIATADECVTSLLHDTRLAVGALDAGVAGG